ncbi:MAG: bifunctional demethylmenaquinone methyltransferase/2-methoxy-6-polyprenyl-1,4-benzoquinol methylase UbiE [Rikenellaceae bacterium]|nr:bifunctional demethylmenaquinone methyltransferase/2-methoxy-6-polyprenyl-1,4-benzoquinol methylase UbiE [Rikenellaceae bacterium]
MSLKPYNAEESKKEQVRTMFDRIAFRYDLLNRVLSFGVDRSWRRRTIAMVSEHRPSKILDLATGTGDMVFLMAEKLPAAEIHGADLSQEMLTVAKEKARKKFPDKNLFFQEADGENLPYGNNDFDAATISFGIRNFENIPKGLQEIYRVLNQGGRIYILEFSMPDNTIINKLYTFYFRKFLPYIGGWVSGDSKAYRYLQESVEDFPYGERFLKILTEAGFKENKMLCLTFGLVTIYSGVKK